MKTSTIALLAIIGTAAAGKPQLSINVQDGKFDDLEGLDPTLTWSDSTAAGDFNIEYGIEAAAKPTSDLASLPKKIWGKLSTDGSGWGVSARADFDGVEFSKADIEIDATNDEADIDIHIEASASQGFSVNKVEATIEIDATNDEADIDIHIEASASEGFSVNKVEATKSLDSDGATITINPRYDVDTEEADIVVAYSKDDTSVEITASQDAQSVTFSQQIDDDNRVSPTLASSGDISLEWERSLGDGNSLTATLKPNESIDVEWEDDSWTANINIPIDGTDVTGTNVSIKREVNF
eukprot:CAMPEP_0197840036 /NCGR_PEP_ID=MMETSP1437-20131217/45373_1 /TAXON_ID=49252 ORGANISM="Eucampia antarctica, Strain CCMP1452" /NCGR_SAMPLE_ID=MMETSP1437 /ASSEMBLY_ACC=CAM_ASM_001096 /LENGTH=295 /DNA_ID=CAMNT_0043449583 /DNA_START=58 /DNA_END=945 /DNA_ORIENTATION=+